MGTAAPTIRRGELRRAIDTRPRWVAAAIGVLTIGTMVVIAVGIGGPMKDLEVYLLAGRAFGRGADIYAAGFGHVLATPLPYTYPPSWAAALSLVAWLPRGWLGLGWTLLNVALLLWVTRVSYRAFLDGQGAAWPVALACVAGIMAFSAPVLSVFDLGQVGILLLAMVLADTIPRTHAAAARRAGRRGDRHQAHAGGLRRVLDRHEALARRGDGDRERGRYLGGHRAPAARSVPHLLAGHRAAPDAHRRPRLGDRPIDQRSLAPAGMGLLRAVGWARRARARRSGSFARAPPTAPATSSRRSR